MDDTIRCTSVLSNGFRCILAVDHRGVHKIDRQEKPVFEHAPAMEPSQISTSLVEIVTAQAKEIANIKAIVVDFETRLSESEAELAAATATLAHRLDILSSNFEAHRNDLPDPAVTPNPAVVAGNPAVVAGNPAVVAEERR